MSKLLTGLFCICFVAAAAADYSFSDIEKPRDGGASPEVSIDFFTEVGYRSARYPAGTYTIQNLYGQQLLEHLGINRIQDAQSFTRRFHAASFDTLLGIDIKPGDERWAVLQQDYAGQFDLYVVDGTYLGPNKLECHRTNFLSGTSTTNGVTIIVGAYCPEVDTYFARLCAGSDAACLLPSI